MQVMEKNKKIHLIEYDINQDHYSLEEINLRILPSIKGISQFSIATTLYLCGNNEVDDPSSQASGAFLLSVSGPAPKEVSILINSRYPHYNPSLYGYRDNHLIVIGGKNQVKCEMYNIKFNRWRQMHDLPEERYHCSLMTDKNDEYLYVCGGKSKKELLAMNSIIRTDLQNYPSQWERIMINEDANFLSRCKMSTYKSGNSNLIYILGGKDNQSKELYDDVIIYDSFCRILKQSSMKLKSKITFNNCGFIDVNKVQYYFMGSKGEVLMINSKNHNVELNSFI